jgi:hypothetical protein
MKMLRFSTIILVFALILQFQYQVNAANKSLYAPTKLSDCSAKLDNGVIIDLRSLDNNKSPR